MSTSDMGETPKASEESMTEIEIDLDDDLYDFAKKRADEAGITVEEYLSKILTEEVFRANSEALNSLG